MVTSIIINADEEIKAVEDRLRLLLTTPKGTMPMNRNYGIDFGEVLDKPMDVAQNCYAAEVFKAVEAYEETVIVSSVECRAVNDSDFIAIITLQRKEAA